MKIPIKPVQWVMDKLKCQWSDHSRGDPQLGQLSMNDGYCVPHLLHFTISLCWAVPLSPMFPEVGGASDVAGGCCCAGCCSRTG